MSSSAEKPRNHSKTTDETDTDLNRIILVIRLIWASQEIFTMNADKEMKEK